MFNGYFSREWPEMGVSQVCYYDHTGHHILQEYYRNEPEPGTTRPANCTTVADPIEEGRKLVSLLNGGRDFGRIADELKAISQAIGDLQDSLADRFPKL